MQAGGQVQFSSSPPIQAISRTFRIFSVLRTDVRDDVEEKSELHTNLFEFKINIKDCTLKINNVTNDDREKREMT